LRFDALSLIIDRRKHLACRQARSKKKHHRAAQVDQTSATSEIDGIRGTEATHSSSNMSRRCTASIPASASTAPGPAFPITAPPAAAAIARRPRSLGRASPAEEEETARRAHARRPAPSDAEADARSARVGRAAGAAAIMRGVGRDPLRARVTAGFVGRGWPAGCCCWEGERGDFASCSRASEAGPGGFMRQTCLSLQLGRWRVSALFGRAPERLQNRFRVTPKRVHVYGSSSKISKFSLSKIIWWRRSHKTWLRVSPPAPPSCIPPLPHAHCASSWRPASYASCRRLGDGGSSRRDRVGWSERPDGSGSP
jgi:hypothetical protein